MYGCVLVFIKYTTTVACVHSINAAVNAMMNYHSAIMCVPACMNDMCESVFATTGDLNWLPLTHQALTGIYTSIYMCTYICKNVNIARVFISLKHTYI